MKKTLTALFLIAVLIIFFGKIQVSEALALLLLAGVIPGTNITLTPSEVILVCALSFGFILARIITPGVRSLLKIDSATTQPRKA